MAPRLSLGDLASVNTLRRFVPYKLRADLKKSLVYPLQALKATGRADLFSNVSIETTTTCTRQCAYCPHSVESARQAKHERGLFMSPELFTNITDQLQALGFSGKLALQGFGEPLADPDIIARIQEAREKMPFAYITINSNAQLLTGELLEKLLAAGLSHIYITNHETDPEQRTALGVKIKALRADPRFATCISYYTKLTSLRNRGGAVDPTKFQQFESEGRTSNSTGREICASETSTLNITASGNVLVCGDSFTEDPDSVMGNLNESTIPEIYLSQKFQEI
ncbi:MAG: radical SAM protein, partial [Candidatus Gracilibacteria bacterium]